jgi:hypothetical protein
MRLTTLGIVSWLSLAIATIASSTSSGNENVGHNLKQRGIFGPSSSNNNEATLFGGSSPAVSNGETTLGPNGGVSVNVGVPNGVNVQVSPPEVSPASPSATSTDKRGFGINLGIGTLNFTGGIPHSFGDLKNSTHLSPNWTAVSGDIQNVLYCRFVNPFKSDKDDKCSKKKCKC